MIFACISILELSSGVKRTFLSVTQRTSLPLSVLRLYLLKLRHCELSLCACITTVLCRLTFFIEIYIFLAFTSAIIRNRAPCNPHRNLSKLSVTHSPTSPPQFFSCHPHARALILTEKENVSMCGQRGWGEYGHRCGF